MLNYVCKRNIESNKLISTLRCRNCAC